MSDKQKFVEIAQSDESLEAPYNIKSQISKDSKLYKNAYVCSIIGIATICVGLIRMVLFICECMAFKIYTRSTKETPGFITMVFADILSGISIACSGFHSAAYSMGCTKSEATRNLIYITVFMLPFGILYIVSLALLCSEHNIQVYITKTIIFMVVVELVTAVNYVFNGMYLKIAIDYK